MSSSHHRFSRIPWLKLLLAIVSVSLLLWGFRSLNIATLLPQILTKIQALGWIGGVAFMGIYVLATVLLLPGSILTLGAGVLFGLLAGSVYVFLGATLGATCAFLIGRYCTRSWVQQQIDRFPKFKAISQAVAHQGFKIVLLTRLSPVFPFNLLNYAYGLTSVSLRDYVLGSIGMIPGTIMYVYIGSLTGSLATLGQTQTHLSPAAKTGQLLLQGLGLLATIGVSLYVTKVARQALAAQTEEVAER
jgi:uncharacterized membrane protein YdjX (TVP38/TMEM64 family)